MANFELKYISVYCGQHSLNFKEFDKGFEINDSFFLKDNIQFIGELVSFYIHNTSYKCIDITSSGVLYKLYGHENIITELKTKLVEIIFLRTKTLKIKD